MARYIVVGGGLLGILTARELARDGQDITLIEQGNMAKESSWAGGGILSPLYPWRYPESVTSLATWSQEHYPQLCDSLRISTEIDPEYNPTGMLVIAQDEINDALTWAKHHAKRIDLISQRQIRSLEPALTSPPDKAVWLPDVAHVRNPRLAKALLQEIQGLGVSLITHRPVTGLHIIGNRVAGVTTTDGLLEADVVVICAGAWTARLINRVAAPPHIHPVKGQMLLFKTEPGVIRRMVLEHNRYIIPRRDGRVLFGSTLEESGFDKQTTAEGRDELFKLATHRFPVLKDYPLELQWAGLRPGSPGGVPYIAEHPKITGLFINAGHFRNGVVLGPASARLCADLILQRTPIIPPEPYSLNAKRK